MKAEEHRRDPVHVGFTIYSLSNLDSIQQTFFCDLKAARFLTTNEGKEHTD